MSSLKIVADSQIPKVTEYFAEYGDLQLRPGRLITHEDVQDADILLVRSITPVTKQLLNGSRVRFVGSITAGADHLDIAWLNEAGIDYCIAHGFNAPPVADYVISMIAALQQQNKLSRASLRVGIVGIGHAGRALAARLQALNYDVIYCDPYRSEQEPHFEHTPLTEFADLDLISLHVPLTEVGPYPTAHMINKEFIQRQRPGAVIVNASRGGVISEADLLRYGQKLLWCLDVFENEPNINPAILLQTTIATPHIAGYSVQSKLRGVQMIYRMACEKNILSPTHVSELTLPRQSLHFAASTTQWQEVVLGIFNPTILSLILHERLQDPAERRALFDEMRHQFNYRHEIAFTDVIAENLKSADRAILQHWGCGI